MRRIAVAIGVLLLVSTSAFAQKFNYLTENIDLLKVLPPPPALDSEAQKRDMAGVLEMQRTRTPAMSERGVADNVLSIYRYDDVLGPNFKKDKLPITNAFVDRAEADARVILNATKDAYKRLRPAGVNPEEVHYLGGKVRLPYAYPSGTTLYGSVGGILLANMIPEKSFEIYERADEFSHARLVIGVHYPSDLIAGKLAATVIGAALFRSPKFVADLDAARTELRGVLGYDKPLIAAKPGAEDQVTTGSVGSSKEAAPAKVPTSAPAPSH
jgi:acid phosphatase (class A)